ncbi:MAG: hypothetical protein KKG47_03970 [Proteobacteria bacterium]|nr:hypothetical protein [Pseudomonadota bacterium]MBU1738103.1 hypothetical protein [Pseudomonadota bacterium]
MQDILNEIKAVGSVIGSYIHINGVAEIHSDLPKIFLKKIKEVGLSVDRVIKVNESTRMQANNIELTYDEATILIRPIDIDASLITFCETKANKKLVNMTTGMLANELRDAVVAIRKGGTTKSAAQKPAPVTQPVQPPVQQAPPEPVQTATIDVNKILHGGPLAKNLQAFQDALAMAIGPISDMVMKDTVTSWARAGECSTARLPNLVNMLCKEIDDSSLENEFRQAVANHMN